MATLVIVHGAWGGGWEWADVARALRVRGHDVFTPTLTGLGDRAHLGRVDVGLATHIEDVTSVLECEDLRDVVLCGHSYGGMAATGAVEAGVGRVRSLIYIDALVPTGGESGFDLLPSAFAAQAVAAAAADPDRWRVPIPERLLPPKGWIAEERRAGYIARLRPQPIASFSEPIHLTGAIAQIPRAYIRCTGGDLAVAVGEDPIAPCAARARADGWPYRELPVPHDNQLIDPAGTATTLDELIATMR